MSDRFPQAARFVIIQDPFTKKTCSPKPPRSFVRTAVPTVSNDRSVYSIGFSGCSVASGTLANCVALVFIELEAKSPIHLFKQLARGIDEEAEFSVRGGAVHLFHAA
jgi:hypothetical protein